MKYFLLVLTVFLFCACTSLQPIQQAPQDIQAGIMSSELLTVRDRVRIITTEGTSHRFTVIEINDTHVMGVATNIAITDIAVLEVRQHDETKTRWLVYGSATFVALVTYVLYSFSQMDFGNIAGF